MSDQTFTAASLPRDMSVATWSEAQAPGGGTLRFPEPTAGFGRELGMRLRATGDALRARPIRDVARILGDAGDLLADPDSELGSTAVRWLAATSGLSEKGGRVALMGMARDWTESRLLRLLRTDFPDPAVLDGFVDSNEGERRHARGGRLALHVSSGSVPGVGANSLLRSLLVKCPVVLKPGAGDVVLSVLMRDAIVRVDPDLAESIAVAYWPGGTRPVEDQLLELADTVVVYGGVDTVDDVRSRTSGTTRLVAYTHRIGIGVVGRGALDTDARAARTADEVARSVSIFDQKGCVSPHLVFVEGEGSGGTVSPRQWAELLAEALERLDRSLPPGCIDAASAAAVHQLRGAAELEQLSGEGVCVWSGGTGLGWTVVLDPSAEVPAVCTGRTIQIVPVTDISQVPDRVAAYGSVLQTVAVAGVGDREPALAMALGRVGAVRICSFEDAPWPPAWWRHDGIDPLRSLVTWLEWSPVIERGG